MINLHFTVSSSDVPLPGGWRGRGEGVRVLQEDLHGRHPGGRGGGVDTEPGHVSPAFSSTVNMMKVSVQRALLCAQQHPVPGGHDHPHRGHPGQLHQGM